ncbi:hypothetical protein NEI02_01360 [Brachyspira pilosicoli]|uniref:Uncharacterized protein n=1 Tax=Brachyspira pilosicoli TaxID=52584 RepID=A0AAJ6GA28_BRAPL|nr:hypothetical protein [Brachyspira pilosicoli]MBW5382152.1 hypothetical protein [Brachyspira pilosicoli]WIH90618.1 hypothetical protein NEI02_01360 [Brachyspira pilosicoli]WIH92909.1 hypothetical protein NEI01_01360 [Brachyspira pilosicoli]WIH95198.1 hypothetical protein NEH99_01355 [Brachyspira pilosicoli]
MSFTIPKIKNKKTTLICFSTGIYEKKYLSAILESSSNIDYFDNYSELNQLDKRHIDVDIADKAIEEISQAIKMRLEPILSFGEQNSNYILVIITDCDKAPFDAFNKLKNSILNILNIFNFEIDYHFIFSYRGFEDWMKFYIDNGENIVNLKDIKDDIKSLIKEKHSSIFDRHKEAINKYKQFTNYNSPLDDYENIIDYTYSDFPYFLEYLEDKYKISL